MVKQPLLVGTKMRLMILQSPMKPTRFIRRTVRLLKQEPEVGIVLLQRLLKLVILHIGVGWKQILSIQPIGRS